jgi:hypothetical protein
MFILSQTGLSSIVVHRRMRRLLIAEGNLKRTRKDANYKVRKLVEHCHKNSFFDKA